MFSNGGVSQEQGERKSVMSCMSVWIREREERRRKIEIERMSSAVWSQFYVWPKSVGRLHIDVPAKADTERRLAQEEGRRCRRMKVPMRGSGLGGFDFVDVLGLDVWMKASTTMVVVERVAYTSLFFVCLYSIEPNIKREHRPRVSSSRYSRRHIFAREARLFEIW